MNGPKKLRYYLPISALLVTSWMIRAQSSGTQVNQWTPTADLTVARAAACSARLGDGRVLVAGGRGEAGVLNSVDLYGPDGNLTPASPMREARAGAACLALPDGRVLIAGGNDGSTNLSSAELFDPMTGKWTDAGRMSVARSGHTATSSPWGAIILAGGEESGTIEAFLSNGTFHTLGKLATPRTGYAFATLSAHQILFAGGSYQGSLVDTVEVFDANDNSIRVAGKMLTPRRDFAAASLYDGTVLLSGGLDDQGKALATTEIFDPARGVSIFGPAMRHPRARHEAYLLPNNGKVLIAGGSDGTEPLAGSEVYTPWEFRLEPTGGMHSGRTALAGQILRRGAIVVAGGRSQAGPLAGTEVYSFSTIESEKPAYVPGEVATLTGQGWKPGETVQVTASSFPLDNHRTEFTTTAQADVNGQVRFSGPSMDNNHVGVRFLVRAAGSESSAQTSFTDAIGTTVNLSAPASTTVGAEVTLVATVAAGPDPAPVDGVVTFTDQTTGVVLGTAPVDASHTATLITQQIRHGSTSAPHNLVATYTNAGSDYSDSSSTPSTITVSKNQANFTLEYSPHDIAVGDDVTITFTVLPAAPGFPAATGNATLYINSSTTTITLPLDESGKVIFHYAKFAAGPNQKIGVSYSGDTEYRDQSILRTNTPPFTVGKGTPAWLVTTSPAGPVTYGQAVTLNGEVSGNPSPSATGSATFEDGGNPIAGGSDLAIVNNRVVFPAPLLPVGTHPITLLYSGSVNYSGSTSAPYSLVVEKAVPTTTLTATPTNSPVIGSTITLTAKLVSPNSGAGLPPGTVTFLENESSHVCDAVPVTGGGADFVTATCPITFDGTSSAKDAGPHSYTAVYNPGSTNWGTSQGALAITVSKPAPVITGITSTPSSPTTYGQSVTFTAVISVASLGGTAPLPVGTLQFYDGGSALGTAVNAFSSDNTAHTVTYRLTIPSGPLPLLASGNHSITAVYLPGADPNYSAANSTTQAPPVSLTHVVNQAGTTTNALTVTATPPSIVFGEPVTFAADVTADPGSPGDLTGVVQFYDYGSPIGAPQSLATVGSVKRATLSGYAGLSRGLHSITATFLGEANYKSSSSAATEVTVDYDPTRTVLGALPVNPQAGTPIVLTAQVCGLAPGSTLCGSTLPALPGGTVSFYDGATLLGTAGAVDTSGTARLTMVLQNPPFVSPLVGAHSITAVYNGHGAGASTDPNFTASTSAPAILTVGSGVTTTSLTVGSSINPSVTGQAITLIATFNIPPTQTVPPTGTIAFLDGAVTLGTAPIVTTGGISQATLAIPNGLAVGEHPISAAYSGDGVFPPISSSVLQQVVNRAPTVTTLMVVPAGQGVTVTAVVTVPVPGAGTPSGRVEFIDVISNNVIGSANVSVIGNVTTASLTTQLDRPIENLVITATYQGDTGFAPSTSDAIGQSVSGTQISAVNGASFSGLNLADESWVTIYGDGLSDGQQIAQTVPYPTELGGITVRVTDAKGVQRLAPLYFVSQRQINLVLPPDTALGLATVTLNSSSGTSGSTTILVTRTGPGLFSANASGKGVAAAYIQRVKSDGSQTIENVATYDSDAKVFVAAPVTRGSDDLYLELFGTGIRYVPGLEKVTCTIGGREATVLYAGSAPGYIALDQVSVKIPDGLSGPLDVVITVDGQTSNMLSIALK